MGKGGAVGGRTGARAGRVRAPFGCSSRDTCAALRLQAHDWIGFDGPVRLVAWSGDGVRGRSTPPLLYAHVFFLHPRRLAHRFCPPPALRGGGSYYWGGLIFGTSRASVCLHVRLCSIGLLNLLINHQCQPLQFLHQLLHLCNTSLKED